MYVTPQRQNGRCGTTITTPYILRSIIRSIQDARHRVLLSVQIFSRGEDIYILVYDYEKHNNDDTNHVRPSVV